MEEKSGKAKRSGKRVVRDLAVSDAATPDVRGGQIFQALSSSVSEVVKNIGGALQTAARQG